MLLQPPEGRVDHPRFPPYNSEALQITNADRAMQVTTRNATRNAEKSLIGSIGNDDRWNDDTLNAPYAPLRREEAVALRALLPQVSPWRVVAVQMAAGLVCIGIVGLITRNGSSMWSSVYGVAATVLPSALLARGMTRRARPGASGAAAAAAGFVFWEMLKIGVSIAMLAIAAKVVPGLSWPVLLITMVVCMKVNWFALLWRGAPASGSR